MVILGDHHGFLGQRASDLNNDSTLFQDINSAIPFIVEPL
jgi:hypothetical protein